MLARGISTVYSWFQHDEFSVESLKSLYLDAQKKQTAADPSVVDQERRRIAAAIETDHNAIATRDNVAQYAGGFLKTAGLFMRGRIGLVATVGLHGLDQWNTSESWQAQFVDLGTGMAKGAGTRLVFDYLGQKPLTAASKGVSLGTANSTLDALLSRQSYKAGEDHYSMCQGLGRALSTALSISISISLRAIPTS